MSNIDSKTRLDVLNEVIINISDMYRELCREETEAKFNFLDAQRALNSDGIKESLPYKEYMLLSDKKKYYEKIHKEKELKCSGISAAREVVFEMIDKEYKRMRNEEMMNKF